MSQTNLQYLLKYLLDELRALTEVLAEQAVTVDLNKCSHAIHGRQPDAQFLRHSMTKTRLACAWRPLHVAVWKILL